MKVYRIVKTKKAAADLSGRGAFTYGGRWNSKGTHMLYTSENSSLAYLENLVHLDESELPSDLYIMEIDLADKGPVYTVPEKIYPADWQQLEQVICKQLGDQWMASMEYLAVKVKSAVNPTEFNYLLNPLFPEFAPLVQVRKVSLLMVDTRFVKR